MLGMRRSVWTEVALVVAVAGAEIGPTAAIAHNRPDHGDLGVAGITLLLLGAAALPWRLRYPSWVLGFVFVTTAAYWGLGYARGPIFFALIIALINAVMTGHRRAAIASVVAGFLCNPWLGYLLGRSDPPSVGYILGLAAWLVALISLGEALRNRRDQAREAARSQAEALRRRATEERLRIARELHDVVAHNMSLISIQAGVALHLIDSQPEQARSSLQTIKDASKETLVELRSILGVLRHVDAIDDPDTGELQGDEAGAPRSPVPGLHRVGELVDRARSAGIDVCLEMTGELDDRPRLPRQVDLAAYRIVQESLTNVVRHSDDRAATVRIQLRDGGLAVDILDEGSRGQVPRSDLPRGGNGIAGMRERAASVGGRLEAGPRPGRGFAVRAWLPIEADGGAGDSL
jgi:signal transduction histidine kinase